MDYKTLAGPNSHSNDSKIAMPSDPEVNPADQTMKITGTNKVLKYFSLTALTLQNAILILVMRYVRTRPGDMFVSSTAVVMSESIKFTVCMFLILFEEGGVIPWLKHLRDNIIRQPMDCLKISVPSVVYVLQNNLLYIAVSNLDAATFQVTYQLKLLTTALFSVIMLRKQLGRIQWAALFLLFVGVAIVQLQPADTFKQSKVHTEQNPIVGLAAVSVSCLMSGFAGVYFEKILKGTQQSLWLRNVQLGFLGMVFGLITMEFNDGRKVHEKGYFYGYTPMVWFVICLQSFGGLMVAMVVKYADNILKGFATSAAIVISCIASIYFFDFQLSIQFMLGATAVMISIYLYAKFVPSASKPANKDSKPIIATTNGK